VTGWLGDDPGDGDWLGELAGIDGVDEGDGGVDEGDGGVDEGDGGVE